MGCRAIGWMDRDTLICSSNNGFTYILQHTIVDHANGSMQAGCCVLLSSGGGPSKHFPSNSLTKRYQWGLDFGTAEASVLVLLDQSTDHEPLRQSNNKHDANSVVLRHHADTACIFWWPGERPTAVLVVPHR
jgi:hypothetical protein